MATVLYFSMHTGKRLALPRDEMISQVTRCEKQTFSRTEALDFGTELKKRNFELIIMVDDDDNLQVNRPICMSAYMVLAFVKPGNTVILHKICVQPKYKSQGLGSKILKAQIERLRGRGCSKLQLWSDDSNVIARKMYTSIGFRKVSSVPNYYAPGRNGVQMVTYL